MACHKQPAGDHSTYSYLFCGGPGGFQDWNKIELPTDGAHEITLMDPGNIYHRRFELGYISSIHDAGQPRQLKNVSWKAEEKDGSKLRFEFRSADTREKLESAEWKSDLAASPPARYWQYPALFMSADGSNYPVLSEVSVLFQSR